MLGTVVRRPGGGELTVKTVGRGEVVVWVHGSSGHLDSWDPVSAHLRDRCTSVTYSRAAYRPSRRPRGPISTASEVDDLFAVVAATGVRQVHLVGGSYGAIVSLHAARDPRARWRTVSLFEPPLFARGAGLEPVLARYRAAVRAGRLATAARLFATDIARVPTELLGPASESHDPVADVAPQTDGSAVATAAGCGADLEALVADDTDLAHWGDITVPILLLQGELTWEPMLSTMARLRQVLPPSTEHVVLAGQSHFAPHTSPALFAAALLAFLERHTESM